MNTNGDVEVIFCFEDDRTRFNGYRPAHMIKDDYLTTGLHEYYENTKNNNTVMGNITFITPEYYPNCLWIGKKIDMYDGKTKIGTAKIIKINNPILKKSH